MKNAEWSIMPKDLDEAVRYADLLANSDMIPKDYQGKPANVLLAMQMGLEVGIRPTQAIQNIGKVGNRPAIWGDLTLALVYAHPQFEGIEEWVEYDDDGTPTRGVCRLQRAGREVEQAFTREEAIQAGLWGKSGPWQDYPARMLLMRARAFNVRDTFPDALKGLSVAEEAMDIPTAEPVMDTGTAAAGDNPVAALNRQIQEEAEASPKETAHPPFADPEGEPAANDPTPEDDPKDVPEHVKRRGYLIDRMQEAWDLDELEALRSEAEGLPSHDGSRSMAGQAYKQRKRELVTTQKESEGAPAGTPEQTAPPGAEGAFGDV